VSGRACCAAATGTPPPPPHRPPLLPRGPLHLPSLAPAPAPQILADAGVGMFLPNTVSIETVGGCDKGPKVVWCKDLFDFIFFGKSHAVSPEDFQRIAAT
jgi:hypothetical protein